MRNTQKSVDFCTKEVTNVARAVVCITPPSERSNRFPTWWFFGCKILYSRIGHSRLSQCLPQVCDEKQRLPGSSRFVVNNILYLCLFSPKGEVLGIQGATHRNLYNQAELSQYDKIEPIQTPIGNIFLCVDVDIYHPQVLRIARMKGAQIVIASQFIDSYQLSRHMLTTGIWNAAQSNGVYVVGCCNCFLRSLLLLSDTGRKRLSGSTGKLPFAVCKVIPQ